jgi:hypothetical protein
MSVFCPACFRLVPADTTRCPACDSDTAHGPDTVTSVLDILARLPDDERSQQVLLPLSSFGIEVLRLGETLRQPNRVVRFTVKAE